MDQQKIGEFLKELRRGKDMTQEQLAEKFNISRRTVSRWETGSNLPDLSLLIELADFYDVDLRELLDGERRTEPETAEDIKETAVMIADKANDEKAAITARMHLIFIGGLICFTTYLLLLFLVPENDSALYGFLHGILLGVSFGTIILGVIITSRFAGNIREAKKSLLCRIKDNGQEKQ